MGCQHPIASRKCSRSVPDIPEGPVSEAKLTLKAPTPNDGKGRLAEHGDQLASDGSTMDSRHS
jgi:hypothetical protein